jgi:tetratricopeptide (TPR) repeat protein
MKQLLTIFFLLLTGNALAQNGEVVKGNKYFKEGNYDKAQEAYRKALNKQPKNNIAQYNLGNTLYKKEQTEEAIQSFHETAAAASEAELKAKALYNKGVIHHKNNQLPEAIDAYKQALRLTPNDAEIRKNLQLALIKQNQQQQPKENKQQKKQEQKPKEQKEKKQDQQKQQPPPQPSRLSRKQVEQYLKALEQKERQLQEKMQKKVGAPSQPEKDW